MKAVEVTATIDEQGQLALDWPLKLTHSRRVRVIVLLSEEDEPDPDDLPESVVLEGRRQGLQEAISDQTVPLSQMWDGIDTD